MFCNQVVIDFATHLTKISSTVSNDISNEIHDAAAASLSVNAASHHSMHMLLHMCVCSPHQPHTGPPSPILTVNLTVGLDSTLVLVWELPSDGGSPISKVVVEALPQGAFNCR